MLAAGVFLVFFAPLFSGPDEPRHLLRLWAVSRGQLLPEVRDGAAGSTLPCELPSLSAAVTDGRVWAPFRGADDPAVAAISERLRPSRQPRDCFVEYTTAAVYTPVAYLAPAAAMRLARLADAGATAQLRIARLTNLLVSWLLVGAALRAAPSISWTILALATIPMATFLRSTHVSDSLLGALSLLLVAMAVRALERREGTGVRSVLAAILLVAVKPLYLLLPAVALLPGRRDALLRRTIASLAVAALAIAAGTALALLASHAGYVPPRGSESDTFGRAAALAASPSDLLALSLRDLGENAGAYRRGFVGILGWLDALIPEPASYALLALLVLIVFVESQQLEPYGAVRVAALLIVCGSVLLVQLSLYASWTRPGYDGIVGVQGRYFLPIAPVVILAIPRIVRLEPRFARIAGLLFVPASLVVTLLAVAERYWL